MKKRIENLKWVKPRSDDPEKNKKYQAIYDAGKSLFNAIIQNTKDCSERSSALRKVRRAVITANCLIAVEDHIIEKKSGIEIARDILRKSDRPLHLKEIYKLMLEHGGNTKENSLRCSLGSCEEIIKTAPNTFTIYESTAE